MSEPFLMTLTDKQQEFVSSESDILMFGGNFGGGKSHVLLIDALGLNDPKGPRIKIPEYRALIYRKQYKHLLELVDKSQQIYPKIDGNAIYNKTSMTWVFGSGATLTFAYFENLEGAQQLQGRELDFAGGDEVGLYESASVMEFVISRLRSSHGLKPYYRCTSNPSPFKWLRQYFNISPTGESTYQKLEVTLSDGSKVYKEIEYIQSKLSDNPYIPKEYEANLQLLPEAERLAYLDGRWDSFDISDATVYRKELDIFYKEHRYCRVPYQREFQLYASFDIGRNDNTSVIFFQLVGKEIHIINSFENRFQDISYYIAEILKKYDKNVYIILPHDAKQHRIETKNSVYDTVKESFKNVTVLEKYGIEDGIDISRRKFKNIFIDNKNNDRLIECITNYKRQFNASQNVYGSPIHDEFSNFADSFRYMCVFEKEEPVVLEMGYYAPFSGIL
jgi:hypothetical protein